MYAHKNLRLVARLTTYTQNTQERVDINTHYTDHTCINVHTHTLTPNKTRHSAPPTHPSLQATHTSKTGDANHDPKSTTNTCTHITHQNYTNFDRIHPTTRETTQQHMGQQPGGWVACHTPLKRCGDARERVKSQCCRKLAN